VAGTPSIACSRETVSLHADKPEQYSLAVTNNQGVAPALGVHQTVDRLGKAIVGGVAIGE
jgi:hypothetical protein